MKEREKGLAHLSRSNSVRYDRLYHFTPAYKNYSCDYRPQNPFLRVYLREDRKRQCLPKSQKEVHKREQPLLPFIGIRLHFDHNNIRKAMLKTLGSGGGRSNSVR